MRHLLQEQAFQQRLEKCLGLLITARTPGQLSTREAKPETFSERLAPVPKYLVGTKTQRKSTFLT
jgi:hypothetical protein